MRVSKEFSIAYAHCVTGAYSEKCQREVGGIHGHNARIEVEVLSKPDDCGYRALNAQGMVLDFKQLSDICKPFLEMFDHTLLINIEDAVLVTVGPLISARYIILPYNPTAENMAIHFHKSLSALLVRAGVFKPYHELSLTVWETPTSKAVCGGENTSYLEYANLAIRKVEYSSAVLRAAGYPVPKHLLTEHELVMKDGNLVKRIRNCK